LQTDRQTYAHCLPPFMHVFCIQQESDILATNRTRDVRQRQKTPLPNRTRDVRQRQNTHHYQTPLTLQHTFEAPLCIRNALKCPSKICITTWFHSPLIEVHTCWNYFRLNPPHPHAPSIPWWWLPWITVLCECVLF